MNSRQLLIFAVALTTLLFGFVVPALQGHAAETQTAAQTEPMQFANGAKTWANTCARCHNMRDPKSLRDDQWRAAIAHMRVRAGLTAKEAENVLVFLQQSN